MRRVVVVLAGVLLVGGLTAVAQVASAHQCPDGDTSSPECRPTAVYPDYRPNYVPLFDLPDRDDPEQGEAQRYDAQRWRDECSDDGEERQQCAWAYGGQSIAEYDSDEGADPLSRPNELHVGFAASHCFLAEGAHDCDSHGDADEFATHDSHGGAAYVDVCLAANPDSQWCDDGMRDTQAGVTIVDHLGCPFGCFDEYHVVRPADGEYTQAQLDDSVAAVPAIAADPVGHLCGHPEHSACR